MNFDVSLFSKSSNKDLYSDVEYVYAYRHNLLDHSVYFIYTARTADVSMPGQVDFRDMGVCCMFASAQRIAAHLLRQLRRH